METKGIMGLFPLIPNLPVRLTETIDRKLRLHKHRQAYVRRWCLHPGETSTLRDGVRELRKMPTCIILFFPEWTEQVHPDLLPGQVHRDLAPGEYPLEPVWRTWTLNREHNTKVSRFGFTIIPHFSCTAHMVQGMTLRGIIANCLKWDAPATLAGMLSGYVSLSRVKEKTKLLLVEAFSPLLFGQGAPAGPRLLMEVLRGSKTLEEAQAENTAIEAEKTKTKAPKTREWKFQCGICHETLPLEKFNLQKEVPGASQIFEKLIETGYWRACKDCSQAARGKATRHAELACSFCGEMHPRCTFLEDDIDKYDARKENSRRCLSCRQKHADPAQYFKCAWCPRYRPVADMAYREDNAPVCGDCFENGKKLICSYCQRTKPRTDFDREE